MSGPALPWGRGPSGSVPGLSGEVEISLLPCGGASSSAVDSFRRMLFGSPSPKLPMVGGCIVAPAGSAYVIEVTLRERTPPRAGALRVVRASIDADEVNEQLVLRSGQPSSAKFVGWLEDDSGAKRLHFTFPVNDRESLIQISVFDATEVASAGKQRAGPRPPATAMGAAFQGPPVGRARYSLGEPVACGVARLRAELPSSS